MEKHVLDMIYQIHSDILAGEGYSQSGDGGLRPDRRVILSSFRTSARIVTDALAYHQNRLGDSQKDTGDSDD